MDSNIIINNIKDKNIIIPYKDKGIKKVDHPYIIKDVIQGDDILASEDNILDSFSQQEIQDALQLIYARSDLTFSQKNNLIANLWRITYEVKPPTMDEFLTPKYLGKVGDTIYSHVKDVLIEYMNPNSKKRVLALSCCTSYGKSSLSTFLIIYILINLQFMRNPKKYFNMSDMGSIVAVLLSFTLKKANQLLLQPFVNVLKSSPIFHATRLEDGLEKKQKEIPKGHIAYTLAGRLGAIQLSKDLHVTVESDRASLLGLNIIAGVASEISFWIKKGIAAEEIWGTFTDLRERINSRFAHSYLTTTILDSSPLDLDLSPIDKWLYTGEAEKDPEVMFVNSKQWEVFPEKVPIWNKTGETFPVFRGDSANSAKILTSQQEVEELGDTVFHVPIDFKLTFEQNLKKSIADICAWPSGGLSKLIDNVKYIEDIFTPILKNQYKAIIIPEEKDPTRLIWNQIVDNFFINIGSLEKPKYQFYRYPNVERCIHIDLSETGDISGIGMSHLELNLKGETIGVHDFLIPLHKGKSRINLDAVCNFIIDLRNLGHINIWKVTADQYQSATILQRLLRHGFDAEKFSVDRTIDPYMLYSAMIKTNKIKAGQSIHLKNNLKSLLETKTEKGKPKIDHIQGKLVYEDNGNWNTSLVGTRAKDISDVGCGSIYPLLTEYKKIPSVIFDDRINPLDLNQRKNSILSFLDEQYNLITS